MNKKELLERKRKAEKELTAIAERYAEEALAANVKSLEAAVNSDKKKPKYEPANYAIAQRDMDERIAMEQARQFVMRNQVLNADGTRAVFEQPQPPHRDFIQQLVEENRRRAEAQVVRAVMRPVEMLDGDAV